jgi:ribonuclease HII
LQNPLKRLLAFDQKTREALSVQGLLAGVDEAGCAPLAGPVVAAAVILIRPPGAPALNDSKQLTALQRERIFPEICKNSLLGIGSASETEIDAINIYQARRLAMKRALLSLTRTPDYIFIDGNIRVDIPISQCSIVEGDAKSACIAAASVVAKVYRDRWMAYLDSLYPGYDFKTHKGYPTPRHLQRITEIGPCAVHRKSFAPVRIFLEKAAS